MPEVFDRKAITPVQTGKRTTKEYDVAKRVGRLRHGVATLIYAHLSHAISLNDVCHALQMNKGALATFQTLDF